MKLRTPTLNWTTIYLTIFLSFAAAFGSFFALKLSWNLTPSLPLGLWYSVGAFDINDNPRGKVVSVCPPDTEYFRKARSDGILKWGRCPGGYTPLLKQVAGVPGDMVDLTDHVAINGRDVAHSSLLFNVAALYQVKPLHKKIRGSDLWLMGYYQDSFDSRYFGSIDSANVVAVQNPLFTY